MSDTLVRLFIAMPATNMGGAAEWNDPQQIATHFFGKVAESLQQKLGKPVELVIEKDKVLGGPIHASMFYDAIESDVYIADLTGNNPNVYLELGARWALRDAITVVVSQDIDAILFNAKEARAIQYSKNPAQLESAISKVVQSILKGLAKEEFCDSPVRKNAAIVTYERNVIDQIKSEIQQLRTQAAARAASMPEDQLLRESETLAELMKSLTETGIANIYKTREAAAERMFQDIRSSSQSCWISSAVYISSLIKPMSHEKMTDALGEASNRAGKQGYKYRLSFCSLSKDASPQSLAGERNVSILECWARREDDETIAPLQGRIERASVSFDRLTRRIAERSLAIRPERRFFRDYLVPHSLVVIDDSIVYVSFYDWGTPAGTRALTIRFQGGEWGSKFVKESQILRSRYSYGDYRVIAFDFDGVIADSMVVQAEIWRRASREIAAPPQAQEQLIDNVWMGAAGPLIFENTGLDSESIRKLRQTKDAEFEALETTITVFEHSPQILNALKQARHYKLAIATTAENNRVESFLKRHSLAHCFDYVITDYDVTHGKPHQEMLLKIAEYFECQPWQVCLVGDTHTDYVMSSNAGTDFVLFQSHEAHGVTVECVTARSWRQLEEILLGKNSPNGKT